MDMSRKFYVETYGCQMNVHDSEKLRGILSGLGYSPAESEADADVILLNTCSVREKAAAKVFTRLGQLKKWKQGRRGLVIGVCGCLAQQEGEAFFKGRPFIDLVFGPRNIGQLPDLLDRLEQERGRLLALSGPRQEPTFEVETVLRDSPVKAYITIMEGCDKFCSFCVVPFLRGREVSRDPQPILEEARRLADSGTREICLLGQNVNSYRFGDFDFADLLVSLHEIPGVRRIRYTSPHPSDINPKLMDLYGHLPKLCNNVHLPLQAGSNSVLRRMKRDYTRETYLARATYLRRVRPDITFGTDIIVGFPGETEEDFQQTLDIVEQVCFSNVYSFKYSQRPFTAALKLPDDVPEEVKSERLLRLQDLQKRIQIRLNATMIGSLQEVLVEAGSKKDRNVRSGRTTCNRVVNFSGPQGVGEFASVRIRSAGANSLGGVSL
jgi:tRNA-2-methylthio-N6-dimethylallyladenosine synthase